MSKATHCTSYLTYLTTNTNTRVTDINISNLWQVLLSHATCSWLCQNES